MIQRILAWIDGQFLPSGHVTHDGENEIITWSGFDPDKWMGIVSKDGKIRIIDAAAVKHIYNKDGKLVGRIPVKKDLKPGERLATKKEVQVERERIAMKTISKGKIGMF